MEQNPVVGMPEDRSALMEEEESAVSLLVEGAAVLSDSGPWAVTAEEDPPRAEAEALGVRCCEPA